MKTPLLISDYIKKVQELESKAKDPSFTPEEQLTLLTGLEITLRSIDSALLRDYEEMLTNVNKVTAAEDKILREGRVLGWVEIMEYLNGACIAFDYGLNEQFIMVGDYLRDEGIRRGVLTHQKFVKGEE